MSRHQFGERPTSVWSTLNSNKWSKWFDTRPHRRLTHASFKRICQVAPMCTDRYVVRWAGASLVFLAFFSHLTSWFFCHSQIYILHITGTSILFDISFFTTYIFVRHTFFSSRDAFIIHVGCMRCIHRDFFRQYHVSVNCFIVVQYIYSKNIPVSSLCN